MIDDGDRLVGFDLPCKIAGPRANRKLSWLHDWLASMWFAASGPYYRWQYRKNRSK